MRVQGNARLAEASMAEEVAARRRERARSPPVGRAERRTPFLPPVTEDVALDLIETRSFGSRVIYERYGRAGDESDGYRSPSHPAPAADPEERKSAQVRRSVASRKAQ